MALCYRYGSMLYYRRKLIIIKHRYELRFLKLTPLYYCKNESTLCNCYSSFMLINMRAAQKVTKGLRAMSDHTLDFVFEG